MEYTAEIFAKFLNKLGSFDNEVKTVLAAADKQMSSRETDEKKSGIVFMENLNSCQELRYQKVVVPSLLIEKVWMTSILKI